MSYQGDVPPFVSDLQKKLQSAADEAFKDVHEHVNFTLQRAYFKCAYECFDRSRSQQEISHCVERCSSPVVRANTTVQNEMSRFQERLSRNLMVCQDKFEAERLVGKADASSRDLENCMESVVKEQMKTLPHLAAQVKSRLPPEPTSNF